MKDKKTLITIIILLICVVPLAIYGTVKHIMNKDIVVDDNPNKDYILNNKVYFYDSGILKGTYKCANECKKITTTIDDNKYSINYYMLGKNDAPEVLPNNYALFEEDQSVALYSIDLKNKVLQFDAVKNYNVNHSSPVLIIKNNGKYGVLSLSEFKVLVSNSYDFIAIPNRVVDGVLDTSRFIGKKGNYWYVLESDGSYNHEEFIDPIVDFNDNYVIVKNQDAYKIYDYDKKEYLLNSNKKAVYCLGSYVLVIDESNNLLVYQNVETTALKAFRLPEYKSITFDYKDGNIVIYLDNKEYQSLVLK